MSVSHASPTWSPSKSTCEEFGTPAQLSVLSGTPSLSPSSAAMATGVGATTSVAGTKATKSTMSRPSTRGIHALIGSSPQEFSRDARVAAGAPAGGGHRATKRPSPWPGRRGSRARGGPGGSRRLLRGDEAQGANRHLVGQLDHGGVLVVGALIAAVEDGAPDEQADREARNGEHQ